MSKRERRDRGKEKFWRRMLGLWGRSGLTGRDFCAEHQLSEPSFYAWRREIARRDEEVGEVEPTPESGPSQKQNAAAAPAFLEVMVDGVSRPSAMPAAIEVVVNGWLLRVRPGFDVETLRQLLGVLQELEERAC